MALTKTSVQIDGKVRDQLLALYPELTISEIVRLALDFVLEREPQVEKRDARFKT